MNAAQIAAAPLLRYAVRELAAEPTGRAKLEPKIAALLTQHGIVTADSVETFRGCSWQICQLTAKGWELVA